MEASLLKNKNVKHLLTDSPGGPGLNSGRRFSPHNLGAKIPCHMAQLKSFFKDLINIAVLSAY